MSDLVIKASMGRLWIQPLGSGHPVYPLACKDSGDLTESEGEISELIQCLNPNGQMEWQTLGDIESAPEMIDFSVDALVMPERDYLERLKCRFALYIHRRDCGRADVFGNYIRAHVLTNVKRTSKTHSGLFVRAEDTPSQLSVDLQAWPPLLEVVQQVLDIKGTTATHVGLRGVYADTDRICSGCPSPSEPGQLVVTVGDSVAGATPNVYYSTDYGVTISTAGNDPGAIDDDLAAVTRVGVGKTTIRTIIARYTPAASQGRIFYSDDLGATAWSSVAIGGAVAGDGALTGECLWSVDMRNIWLCTAIGHIYKSTNGGVTWTLVENAIITVNDYNSIRFCNNQYGMAVGDTGIVALSDTGGNSWYAATAIAGAPVLTSCWRFNKYHMQVFTSLGLGYQSFDGGVTWEAMTIPAEVVGQALHIAYANEYQGYLSGVTAGGVGYFFRTINGGATFEIVGSPLTAFTPAMVFAASPQMAYSPGNATATQEQLARIYEFTVD